MLFRSIHWTHAAGTWVAPLKYAASCLQSHQVRLSALLMPTGRYKGPCYMLKSRVRVRQAEVCRAHEIFGNAVQQWDLKPTRNGSFVILRVCCRIFNLQEQPLAAWVKGWSGDVLEQLAVGGEPRARSRKRGNELEFKKKKKNVGMNAQTGFLSPGSTPWRKKL